MHVLILDAQQRSALAAARSLGSRGIRIHVADSVLPTLAGASRYVDAQLRYPDPYSQPTAFIAWVVETARALQVHVVMPMTDATTMLLAPLQHEFDPVRLACGPHLAYEQLSDKGQLLHLASRTGIRTPATQLLSSVDDLERHLTNCSFPLVLKPARSKVLINDRIVGTAVFVARDAESARKHLHGQAWFGALPCLAQEYIDGEGAGLFSLYADGSPLAWFAHRRLREKPPSGGVSVLCESAPVDTALRETTARLLGTARWHGPAMVEYRIDRNGIPFLMEVNCRFWGSLQLSIDSGVDFPWLWYQMLTTRTAANSPQYLSGRRLRWLLGDADNLLIQMRDPNLDIAVKLRAAGSFLASFADLRCRQEILRWSDPRPALFELQGWVRAFV